MGGMGWPQQATARIAAAAQEPAAHDAPEHSETKPGCPPLAMVLPFGLLLMAIAVLPLLPHVSHWWDSNLHKFYVAGGLSLLTLGYYLVGFHQPVMGHWPVECLTSPGLGTPTT